MKNHKYSTPLLASTPLASAASHVAATQAAVCAADADGSCRMDVARGNGAGLDKLVTIKFKWIKLPFRS